MPNPIPGELPQRQLALELRYAIDVATKQPSDASRDRVRKLLKANPVNARSRHVAHNLGATRIAWLKERPSLGWRD